MAKGRNPALFEVMMKNRPLPQRNRQGLLGWLGGWLGSGGSGATASTPKSTTPPITGTSVNPPGAAPVAHPASAEGALPPISEQGVQKVMMVDSDRGLIYLQLSFTSAAICVVAILTVIALAFMVGQKSTRRPALAARSDEDIRQQPPQPNLTDLSQVRKSTVTTVDGGGNIATPPAGTENVSVNVSGPTEHVVKDRNRSIGLNYVVIQSYPAEKMAIEVMNLLMENGVECTVEKTPADWMPGRTSWFSVIGIEGFARMSGSAHYEAYLRKIKEVSDKVGGKKSFKAFEPRPYKWKKAE